MGRNTQARNGVDVRLSHLLFERVSEAVQFERSELLQGIVFEHGRVPFDRHW